jgi:RNA polymerase sigma-70 factor (ECF subfamily)
MQDWRQGVTGAHARCVERLGDAKEFVELLADARAGSGEAIGALLSQHHDWLLRAAQRELCTSLQARVTAADVVQEAFLNAHISFPAFRGQTNGELAGWLRQLLTWSLQNAVRRHRQSMRRVDRQVSLDSSCVPAGALAADQSTASQRAMRRERDEELELAIARLPERYRRVVLLRHRENRGFAEVAATLLISENAVRKVWTRAVKRLKRELKDVN